MWKNLPKKYERNNLLEIIKENRSDFLWFLFFAATCDVCAIGLALLLGSHVKKTQNMWENGGYGLFASDALRKFCVNLFQTLFRRCFQFLSARRLFYFMWFSNHTQRCGENFSLFSIIYFLIRLRNSIVDKFGIDVTKIIIDKKIVEICYSFEQSAVVFVIFSSVFFCQALILKFGKY